MVRKPAGVVLGLNTSSTESPPHLCGLARGAACLGAPGLGG